MTEVPILVAQAFLYIVFLGLVGRGKYSDFFDMDAILKINRVTLELFLQLV